MNPYCEREQLFGANTISTHDFVTWYNWYSTLLVTCPVTSVKLQIANYFLLTANPIMVLEISLIGLAVSKK